MGHKTTAIKKSVDDLISKYQVQRKILKKLELEHSGWLDTIWGKAQVSHVFGLLAVMDLAGSIHNQVVVNSTGGPEGKHAEMAVRDKLRELYPDGAPFDMKIILYLKRSPCTICTDLLLGEYNEIYDKWAKGRLVYFSITFSSFYIKGNNSWDDITTATEAYDEINQHSPVVSDFNTEVKRLLTIRHYNSTKLYNPNGSVLSKQVSTDWS